MSINYNKSNHSCFCNNFSRIYFIFYTLFILVWLINQLVFGWNPQKYLIMKHITSIECKLLFLIFLSIFWKAIVVNKMIFSMFFIGIMLCLYNSGSMGLIVNSSHSGDLKNTSVLLRGKIKVSGLAVWQSMMGNPLFCQEAGHLFYGVPPSH